MSAGKHYSISDSKGSAIIEGSKLTTAVIPIGTKDSYALVNVFFLHADMGLQQ